MSMLCDNCNGTILAQATGTIRNATFFFCSPQCRAEFAEFSGKIGHRMTIPDQACEERDKAGAEEGARDRRYDSSHRDLATAPARRIA